MINFIQQAEDKLFKHKKPMEEDVAQEVETNEEVAPAAPEDVAQEGEVEQTQPVEETVSQDPTLNCPVCNGEGLVSEKRCPNCQGTGRV